MNLDSGKIKAIIEGWPEPEPFAGVVYLTRGEDVLFEKAQGLAIRSESIPNRVGTRFQMASGCKVFTGVAICQLVERGHLSFDTLLMDCVGVDFPNFAPGITIRHLLTHTSGITSYFEEDVNPDYEALWKDLPVYRVRGPRDFLPLFRDKPMKFAPGKRFDYNDGGFILLGLAIESVAGIDFPSYVRENIFEPAGMGHSGYFPTDQLPSGTAYAYIKNPDGSWRTNFFAVPVIGTSDGGAYTTAPDMARFWSALRGSRLLEPESARLMLEAKVATGLDPPYTHYGHGVWIERRNEATRQFFVVGSDPGVAMKSAVFVEDDIVLTVMGNTGSALWPLCREIERALEL